MRQRKRVQEHAAPVVKLRGEPPRFAVLAIDPGRSSGAAFFIDKQFQDAWQVRDSAEERADVVGHCVELSKQAELPLVAVLEAWHPYGRVETAIGLGDAAGRWREQLELVGIPRRRILKVQVNTWRKAIFGRSPRSRRTEGWKADAVALCKQLFQRELGEDAAEAALIGRWATIAPEVAHVVPTRKVAV